jgi:Holliday junction resolvasome RuvABC DNA-binding subunit
LELKGKLIASSKNSTTTTTIKHNTITEDALIALVNLGINKTMAENAIKKIPEVATLTVEELIKQALRNL